MTSTARAGALADTFGRMLRNLRLSVTDRCNLRCAYCMPEPEYVWLERRQLLTFEEISTLVDVFLGLGVTKLRMTGGEPLLRRNLDHLVRMLAQRPGIEDLAITTNGILLAEQAAALREAGLHRVTVSLDTLRRERFQALTRRDALDRVLRGIEAVRRAGFTGTKIDSVVIRDTNDDEIFDLLEFGRGAGAEVRFIEYMDVGGATQWSMRQVVSHAEILQRVASRYGSVQPLGESGSATAERFVLADGTVFGVIGSTTTPFCPSCDRGRLTADGVWYLCLYAHEGLDLRRPLRDGARAEEIRDLIAPRWKLRRDRGAEERKDLAERGALLPPENLKRDPHLEMHTRGG